jgi:Ca2+-binding RTX toxin-like protein
MATFTGTSGDDALIGTDFADYFYPLLGRDTVDGGGGLDRLTVNYSSAPKNSTNAQNYYSYITANDGSYSGVLAHQNADEYVSFKNIERITFKASVENDFIAIKQSSTVIGGILVIDGGAGSDRLGLDLSGYANGSRFLVAADGTVSTNRGTYTNFENFSINVGTGVNEVTTGAGSDYLESRDKTGINKFSSGAGDDTIYSYGIDTIDAGSGFDSWFGTYFDSRDDLQVDLSGSIATISNGTTIANAEYYEIQTGNGNDTIIGSNSGDVIRGGNGRNTINAGDGDDVIQTKGIDTVDGGAGKDLWAGFYETETADLVFTFNGQSGQLSNGTTLSNIEDATLFTGSGNDTILLTGGYGRLGTGAGFDRVTLDYSGSFRTTTLNNIYIDRDGDISILFFSSGSFSNFPTFTGIEVLNFTAGDGNDTINVYNNYRPAALGVELFISGGLGYDSLNADYSGYSDVNISTSATGLITGSLGTFSEFEATYIKLGAGNSTVTLKDTRDYVTGGIGNDRIDGGSGYDIFLSEVVLNDFSVFGDINGGYYVMSKGILGNFQGFDYVINVEKLITYGGTFDLTANLSGAPILGSALVDSVSGTSGNDMIYGLAGNDVLSGGAGDDLINGGSGNDSMSGGKGSDLYFVDSSGDIIIEAYASGIDFVIAEASYVLPKNVENLSLDGILDINGTGNAANNFIIGNSGKNILSGGSGADFIQGGPGNDTLSGGWGADVFIIDRYSTSGDADTIKDFVSGVDRIGLSGNVFASLSGVAGQSVGASDFIFGDQALNADQNLIYDRSTGNLFYDLDGKGGEAQVLLATFTTRPDLVVTDFLLI